VFSNAPCRESRQDLVMLMQGMINFVVLIEGEVGTDTGLVRSGVNPITDEVHHCFVRLVGLPIPQDRRRPARHPI
jgi:hypothetical protein